MAFILRQRAEPLLEDDAGLVNAALLIRRFDEALVRLIDRDSSGDDLARTRVAQLTRSASDCKVDLEEARWRFLKGDRLGGEEVLADLVLRAQEGIALIDPPPFRNRDSSRL